MARYGPAVLRIAVGAVFLAHGAQKLFGLWGGGGLAGTAAMLEQLGFRPGYPWAALVAVVEFGGGLLLIVGALTMAAGFALLVEMVVATWKVHLSNGFFLNWMLVPGRGHGYEFNLVLIAALLCLILSGAGAFSIDGRRARDAESQAAGRARLRAGQV